jgi:SAM-dependent methyltransferase
MINHKSLNPAQRNDHQKVVPIRFRKSRIRIVRCLILSSLLADWILASGTEPVSCTQSPAGKARYITYDEARPILEALQEALPAELRPANPQEAASAWANWVVHHDAEIRGRLAQGEEDSLINLLLFGTSFTGHPRITLDVLTKLVGRPWQNVPSSSSEVALFVRAIDARADDLVRALATPGTNERLMFARHLIGNKGYDAKKNSKDRERVKRYLLSGLARVLKEQARYASILESARLLGDPSAEFAERSKLFSARGLSTDASLFPNLAIERALESLKVQSQLSGNSVRRVAVIGPGLDFADKQDGYDFYPQQTIQPFAIIDTLLRLGLARANDLKVTTLDLSPRVNDHLGRTRQRAVRGASYVVQLPRNLESSWKPETIDYWQRFGDRIGSPVTPIQPPAGAGKLKVRAVRIRPSIVSLVTPEAVNIVLQRLDLPAGEQLDLIIATNTLVYYDVFEQSLALANIERMLRPGGFLLSNNALLELPSSEMRSVGYQTVVYSDRPDDGDHIVWYQRARMR